MDALATLARRNNALALHPPVADIDITTGGSSWLWAVFSVMAATGLGCMIWGMKISRGERTFHYLSAAILATASIAYFSMASDLGATPVRVEFLRDYGLRPDGTYPTRSIWYARYIDWTITTPLLLLELLLVSGLPLSTIFATIFFDLVMIITGLIGALVQSSYKWGFFTFGCVAMFYVFWVIWVPGLKSASHLGADFRKSYLVSASILCTLWFVYPIAWGLADGGNYLSPTKEMIMYGVLDLLAKPVFALVHLFSLRRCDYSSLHLRSGKFSDYDTDLAGPTPRSVESAKKMEANGIHTGVIPGHNANTTTTGTTDPHGIIGHENFNNVHGNSGLEAAPAMRQTQATQ